MKAFSEILNSREDVDRFFARCRAVIEKRLDELVPSETVEPVNVHSAMRWSLLGGGKRLRPALLIATGEAFGAPIEQLLDAACAFELIHTYSLIHDDLPSMDDDDLRRGRPTCHIRYGEATAILAGDALQALAFETIAKDERLDANMRLRVLMEVAHAAGTPDGMVAGQAFDLLAESNHRVTRAELDNIHRHKTGRMICAASRCGAIIARASDAELEAITNYADQLGLLFQITDDLLDVTATASDLGKTPGKDAQARKATYPSLYGVAEARERARLVHAESCARLDGLKRPMPILRSIADLTLERRR